MTVDENMRRRENIWLVKRVSRGEGWEKEEERYSNVMKEGKVERQEINGSENSTGWYLFLMILPEFQTMDEKKGEKR